jgi:hypothetical protein
MTLKKCKIDLRNSKNAFRMYLKFKITLHVHKYFILLHILINKKLYFVITLNDESVPPVVPQ